MIRITSILVLVLLVPLFSAKKRGKEKKFWPLLCPPALTSMYGDYRPGHFHSGTDLKTWGRVGIPIVAEGGGYVFRLSVSTRGYGRALYIKLDKGGYRVYGHLQSFMPKIEKLVLREQYRRKRYAVKLFFPKNKIRFHKGQVLGKSGESGVGFPHLHYEHRDNENIPLNALTHGLEAGDAKPPVLEEIAVTPFHFGSTVNGGDGPRVFPLTKNDSGVYAPPEAIQAFGCIGLSFKASDAADNAKNRFGIYKSGLFVDDTLIFKCAYDSFDFEETRKINLDRDLFLLRTGKGAFNNLFIEPGNTLPFYGPFQENDGLLQGGIGPGRRLSEGLHKIRIVSVDAAGNGAEAEFDLFFVRPPVIERIDFLPAKNSLVALIEKGGASLKTVRFMVSADGQNFSEVRGREAFKDRYYSLDYRTLGDSACYLMAEAVDSLGLESAPFVVSVCADPGAVPGSASPVMTLDARGDVFTLELAAGAPPGKVPDITLKVDNVRLQLPVPLSHVPGVYRVKFREDITGRGDVSATASLFGIHGGVKVVGMAWQVHSLENASAASVVSQDGRAALEVPEKAVFKKTYAWLLPYIDTLVTRPWPEISPAGPAYAIAPRVIYYDRKVSIAIRAPKMEKVGLFTSMGDLGWSFNSAYHDSAKGAYVGSIKENIPFMLFSDTTPPAVVLIKPRKPGSAIRGRRLRFKVRDRGAGIGSDKSIVTLLDGKWILNEYDFESDIVTIELRNVNKGSHVLQITAEDRLENETRLEVPFFIRM